MLRKMLVGAALGVALFAFAPAAHAETITGWIESTNSDCNGQYFVATPIPNTPGCIEMTIGPGQPSVWTEQNPCVWTLCPETQPTVRDSIERFMLTAHSGNCTCIPCGEILTLHYSPVIVGDAPINGWLESTVTIQIDCPPAVPEPSSLALLGTGLLGLVGAARRRLGIA